MSNTGWGGSVILDNLDDFIAPSQACINPIFSGNSAKIEKSSPTSSQVGVAKVTIESEDFGTVGQIVQPNLIKTATNKTAQVSLSDCLACSGCVTSAEAVLVENHSWMQFISNLKNNKHKVRVVSVSPAALVSIAHAMKISLEVCCNRLVEYLQGLGVTYVLDCMGAHHVSLIEARNEFLYRFQRRPVKSKTTAENESLETQPQNNAHKNETNLRKKARGRRRKAQRNIVWERPKTTKAQSANDIVDANGNKIESNQLPR